MFSFFDLIKFKFSKFDWSLMGGIAILSTIGLVTLASLNQNLFHKQIIWYGLFWLFVFLGSQINWRWLFTQMWFLQGFYWFSVALVLLANFQSGTVRGTKGWIFIGGFQFEPAEITKVALILLLAGFFSHKHGEAWLGKNIFTSFFYAGLPAFFIILHPDLGSAIILLGIWLGFLLMSGFKLRRLIAMFLVFITIAAIGWSFFLHSYQKSRLTSFLFPARDPLGVSYNVIQSKIAIGSAGFFGKGFGLGTQSHLKFLPESETDFIFAAFLEEWGAFGGIVFLLTFLLIVFKITNTGLVSRNNGYRFISLGTALALVIHFTINIGSNIGLMPVTGITLPFVSYGGSSLLTFAILISIIQRIRIES